MNRFYIIITLFITSFAFSQVPTNYYNGISGSGYTLKSNLKTLITNGHIDQGYSSLYTGYQTSDNDSFYENDNTVLDMYSENPTASDPYNYAHDTNGGSAPGQACGNFTVESDCYNREHIFPQGFFDERLPMRSDIHYVVPTDGRVNGFRGNFPFGDVGTNLVSQSNISNPTQNGSKLGNCITPGYSGTVFEPIDEFKGDIARMLLYFAVRYEDNWNDTGWDLHTTTNNPLNGTSDQFYETWYINLLYNWHIQDPVSTRETVRNDAAYDYQGNANPFIDHPEYVQAIWSSVLSINDVVAINQIKLYPNPVKSNTLYFETTKDLAVEVYNILGKQILKDKVTSSNKQLDVSALNKGIYLLKISSDSGTITKKLIRQ